MNAKEFLQRKGIFSFESKKMTENIINWMEEYASIKSAEVCYRFIYKDINGKLGYTIIHVYEQNNNVAIAEFEKTFPDLVWRRFELIK